MTKTLTFNLTGVLGPAGSTTLSPLAMIRVCPWNDTSSHLNGYTAVKVRATARVQGVGTLVLRVFEFNLGTGVPFSPSALRDTNRAEPLDVLTILDVTNPVALGAGVPLSEQVGSICPVVSPQFKLPQDDQNTREWVFVIENTEPLALRYSLDLEIEPTCRRD
jgi:hypothetical protein